ncbi:MAG: BON domain-containing protein [Sneathiella sp.]|nr:BON domain-containing protein [Sneathiella sp.]
MKFVALLVTLVLGLALLTSCTPAGLIIGGIATAGVTIAEERSLEDTVNDASIKLKILTALLDSNDELFADVSTIVIEGRVLVTGEVPNDEDRSSATSIIWSIDGVKAVLNELQVSDKETLTSSSGDSWISAKLRARLVQDLDVKHVNYTIDTVNKIVYVMGIAQDQAELNRVKLHARDISGVRKIISHAVLKKNR